MRYLLIVLLGMLPVLAGAVDFDEATRHLPLGKVMQVYEDPHGGSSIAQVSAPDFARYFRPHPDEVLNAGYSTSVFWLKVELRPVAAPGAAPRQWLLELAYPPWIIWSCTWPMAMAATAWPSAPAMPCPTTAGKCARAIICSNCSCRPAR